MKMFLGDFKELTKDELLSVNGGVNPYAPHPDAVYYPNLGWWIPTATGSSSSPSSNPTTSSGYPSTSSGYPSTSSGYPSTSSGYPSTSSGYPSTSSGYPAASSGTGPATYPATTGVTGTPGSWGQISDADAAEIRMQDERNNGESNRMWSGELLCQAGCKIAAGAQLITQITDGATVSLSDVNKTVDANRDGLLCQTEIAAALNNRLTDTKVTTSRLNADQISIDNIQDSLSKPGMHYFLAQAEGVAGGPHWIILEGSYTNDRGQVEFRYNPSSTGDENNNRRYIIGNPQQGQDNVHKIIGLEIYTIN